MILGAHRSGTSLLAEALQASGLYIAEELVAEDKTVNARGFWEDKQVVAFNEQLFEILESSWYDIRDLPVAWLQTEAVRSQLEAASSYVGQQYKKNPLSVLKDPRMCRLLPFWIQAFSKNGINLAFIINLRSPVAVAASLGARNDIPSSYGHLLWYRYMKDAISSCQDKPTCVVDYDRMLEAPLETLSKIRDQLALDGIEPGDTVESIADKALRHYEAESAISEADNIANWTNQFYNELLSSENWESTESPNLESLLDPTTSMTLYELAATIVENYSSQVHIGNLHTQAQETVSQRDVQLDQANKQRNELEELFKHAESVVNERDSQLKEKDSQLESIQTSLNHAESVVKERDQQLKGLNELEKLFKHAESVVKERDSQLKSIHTSLNHAESVVKERDRQLKKLNSAHTSLQEVTNELRDAHETLYHHLRSNLVGKLALRLISNRSDKGSNE